MLRKLEETYKTKGLEMNFARNGQKSEIKRWKGTEEMVKRKRKLRTEQGAPKNG